MQYVDPYALFSFNILSPSELDRPRLRRAKQKILAEFELSEDIVIEFKDKSLDKATVLQLLEELESPVKREHHWTIHQETSLRLFLENPQVRHLRNVPAAEILGDETFRKFLGQYLAPIFDQLLTQNFKLKRKPEVSLLLQKFDLLPSLDQDTAMRGVTRFLSLNIQTIRTVLEGGNEALLSFRDQELYGSTLMDLMNRLPQAHQHLRNRYADALEDLAIALQNKVRLTNLAFNVICSAAELETDLTTREHVNHMKVELWKRQRAQREEATGWENNTQSQAQDQTTEGPFVWERSNPFDNPSPQAKSKNSSIIGSVVVVLLLVLCLVFLRNSKKSYSGISTPKFNIEIPTINPDIMNSVLDQANHNKQRKEEIMFFFESINLEEVPGKPAPPNARPATNDVVYTDLEAEKGNPSPDILVLENNSSLDLVVFKIDYLSWNIEQRLYIRAGDQIRLEDPIAGIKRLIPYAGRRWQEDWVQYGGESWGGFTQSRTQIPIDFYEPDGSEAYTTVVLSEDYSSSLESPAPTKIVVRFDGKKLRSVYQ